MSELAQVLAKLDTISARLAAIESAPAIRPVLAKLQRESAIAAAVQAMEMFVASGPSERANQLALMPDHQRPSFLRDVPYEVLLETARTMDAAPRKMLSRAIGAANPEIERRIASELAPADDLLRVSRTSGAGAIPGVSTDLEYEVITRDEWVARCARNTELGEHVRAGRVIVADASPADAAAWWRGHMSNGYTIGEFDLAPGFELVPHERTRSELVDAPAADTFDAAAAKRARESAPRDEPEEPPHVATRRYQREQAAREKENRIEETAAAVERALKRSRKPKKGTSK